MFRGKVRMTADARKMAVEILKVHLLPTKMCVTFEKRFERNRVHQLSVAVPFSSMFVCDIRIFQLPPKIINPPIL